MSVSTLRRALLVAPMIVGVAAPTATASPRTDAVEAGILREMNAFRAQHGLPKLRQQFGFARAADAHSAQMLREKKLEHGAYGKRVRRYVRRVERVGENLAWMERCDPSEIVRMWAGSAGHRRVMLSRSFRRVGVARRTSHATCFVTADFGTAK
jgi:uncharacterized protein YkwD